MIARLRPFVPTSTLITLYRSLIFPHLSYGIAVWGQAAQTYLNQILFLQKRALRLIYFAPYGSHAIPLFLSSSSIPINALYFQSISTLMHDVFNKLAPCNISNLFYFSRETQQQQQQQFIYRLRLYKELVPQIATKLVEAGQDKKITVNYKHAGKRKT